MREKIDVDAISDLPGERGSLTLWRLIYVQSFYQLELAGRVKRTDKSIAAILPELSSVVDQHEQASQFRYKEPRAGQSVRRRKRPSPRTLQEWVRRHERSGGDPLSLIPRYSRCGNTVDRFCLEGRRIMGETFEAFLSQQRKTKKIIYDLCRDRFRRENRQRRAAGLDPLRVPSRRTIERALSKLDPYFTRAHRHGVDQANTLCQLVHP